MTLSRKEGPNIKLSDDELTLFDISNGGLINTQHIVSYGNDVVKIGETEFVCTNGTTVSEWKK